MNEIAIKQWNDRSIRIRPGDRYVSLTDMAQASEKLFADWFRLKSTNSYLEALSPVMGIPITELVTVNQGGIPEEQGTWGHPKVAIRFAQWCNDDFAIQVDCWIDELLTTGRVELDQSAHAPNIYELLENLERRQNEQEEILKQLVAAQKPTKFIEPGQTTFVEDDRQELEKLLGEIFELAVQRGGKVSTRELCHSRLKRRKLDGKQMNANLAHKLLELLANNGFGDLKQKVFTVNKEKTAVGDVFFSFARSSL